MKPTLMSQKCWKTPSLAHSLSFTRVANHICGNYKIP